MAFILTSVISYLSSKTIPPTIDEEMGMQPPLQKQNRTNRRRTDTPARQNSSKDHIWWINEVHQRQHYEHNQTEPIQLVPSNYRQSQPIRSIPSANNPSTPDPENELPIAAKYNPFRMMANQNMVRVTLPFCSSSDIPEEIKNDPRSWDDSNFAQSNNRPSK
jgi:hypothetical protein